jgi:glutathione S-transferase
MVCLNNKSQWHVDFNGGMVPILETPNGDLIKESAVIMAFANESGPKYGGVRLIPSDPI